MDRPIDQWTNQRMEQPVDQQNDVEEYRSLPCELKSRSVFGATQLHVL